MAELRVRGGAAGLRGLPLRPEEIPQIARALQFAALPQAQVLSLLAVPFQDWELQACSRD